MSGNGRTLQTAVVVLRVLRQLAATPEGLTAADVADLTGKSLSTATYLLNSLCQESFAVREPDGRYRLPEPTDRAEPPGGEAMEDAVLELYLRTNERAYLATADGPQITIQDSKGRQGLPYVPGLSPDVKGAAHSLAVGKALLAHVDPEHLDAYCDAYGLSEFTPRTAKDRADLEAELAAIRGSGVATDVEEFTEGFCCIAAPVFDAKGAPMGALALSTTRLRFELHGDRLLDVVREIAAQTGHPGQLQPHLRAVR